MLNYYHRNKNEGANRSEEGRGEGPLCDLGFELLLGQRAKEERIAKKINEMKTRKEEI